MNTFKIEKLTENNYDSWADDMESVLVCNNLWDIASGVSLKPLLTEVEKLAVWQANDAKAKACIKLCIDKSQQVHVKGIETSANIWKVLKDMYQQKGPHRKSMLFTKLINMKKKLETTMNAHLAEFTETTENLKTTGSTLDEDLLVILLINSLPESFGPLRNAINLRDELPDLKTTKIKILEEDAHLSKKDDNQGGSGSSINAFYMNKPKMQKGKNADNGTSENKNERFKGKCFNCNKFGHRSVNCKFRRSNKNNRGPQSVQEADTMLAIAQQVDCSDRNIEWCLDSGATSHMCKDRAAFEILNDQKGNIRTAANEILKSHGNGVVRITLPDQNKIIELKNVLYSPEIKSNLMSVPYITTQGYNVIFYENNAKVMRNTKVILNANRKGNLYVVNSKSVLNPENALNAVRDEKALRWHLRMGHLNWNSMKKMLTEGTVRGMNFSLKGNDLCCVTCAKAKITRVQHPISMSRSSEKLGLIHSDLVGPMKVKSVSGARYFATFVDDKTRYTYVAMLKEKGQLFGEFIKYQKLVERETGLKIKILRSDNGGEYVSNEFKNHFTNDGMKHQFTVKDTPEQNGVAERMNRTLVEMARSFMIQSSLPQYLWAELISTAAFIHNRSITRSLSASTTPYEEWYEKKPYLGYFRSIGSRTVALNSGPGKTKFDPKGIDYVLVGYSEESKAYRLWDKKSNKILKACDVKLFEPNYATNFEAAETINFPLDLDNTYHAEPGLTDDEIEPTKDDRFLPQIKDNQVELPKPSDTNELKRGPGRPKLVKTGKRGRPKKVYNIANKKGNDATDDYPNDEPDENVQSENESDENESTELVEHYAYFSLGCSVNDPVTVEQALSRSDASKWKDAMHEEIKSLEDMKTWELVKSTNGHKPISCRWVYRIKQNQDGTVARYKARLVARGFLQRKGINYEETFAPVVRHGTIRMLLALAVKEKMHVHQMDVTTAYVQGELHEELYMEVPEIFVNKRKESKFCRLKRPIYGLKQSGRQWYQRLSNHLMKILNMKQIKNEPCVFTRGKDSSKLIVAIYVDDLIIMSSKLNAIENFKKEMLQEFKMKDLGIIKYCLGIEIERKEPTGDIVIKQSKYINDLLQKFGMESGKPMNTPLDANQKLTKDMSPKTQIEIDDMKQVPYRELCGALIYLSNCTRPDISFAVSNLCKFCENPGREHWKYAKRTLRYLKGTQNHGIKYEMDRTPFYGSADADWASDVDDRRSYTGFVFNLAKGAICWESKKQRTIAASTMEAEYVSISEAAKQLLHIRHLMDELDFDDEVSEPTIINCDNASAVCLTQNPSTSQRSKHIDIRYFFARECQETGNLKVVKQSTQNMMADILTKSLTFEKHKKCMLQMNINNF